MKISELEISKDLKNRSLEPYEILRKHGWKLLGSGVYGAVAEKPGVNYVLKLFDKDTGYSEFVSFVISNPNIHYPTFGKNIRKIPGTERYYIQMEKLIPVTHNELKNNYFPEIAYLYHTIYKYGSKLSPGTCDIIDDKLYVMGIHSYQSGDFDINRAFNAFGSQPSDSWISAVNTIVEYAYDKTITYFDLHTDNFMKRGNTLVINDPWS